MGVAMRRPTATLGEIEIWLRDRLRGRPFYARLKSLELLPTVNRACGWQANVEGDFSEVEADECLGTVIALQRLYALETDTIFPTRERRAANRARHVPGKLSANGCIGFRRKDEGRR